MTKTDDRSNIRSARADEAISARHASPAVSLIALALIAAGYITADRERREHLFVVDKQRSANKVEHLLGTRWHICRIFM